MKALPFHPVTATWFREAFAKPTKVQSAAWPVVAQGRSALLLAPTGSGKTLAAFLAAIDRVMFHDGDRTDAGVRVLYISPLKALGVDVERNLRTPLAGVAAAAEREGVACHRPTVAVRTGDTPAEERRRIQRDPPDILITTPESLYLILTSQARSILTGVETVILDEIHSIVATKRGTHLAVTLERLEDLRRAADPGRPPAQRVGLSATQRPLEEIARFLGGGEITADGALAPRPVEIIAAGRKRTLELAVEMPIEDQHAAAEGGAEEAGGAAAGGNASGPTLPSIWPAIHPRLLELIRQHRSTMIFVNSRQLAERLSAALNELAEAEISAAHHGSIARENRLAIEERLKGGTLPAIVATSSLELGIDMGAVDLVIQVEAPPSVASGVQRIGRAGHHVGGTSRGIVFPKYRGDLLSCAAATARMVEGKVEETFYPRNPLDVLAQQMVAVVSSGEVHVDDLFDTMRRAAPFADLPRSAFEGVLDLLAGRYPSDEFRELRPRVTWDRLAGTLTARRGAHRAAVLNAGTIPDRGLYGVHLSEDGGASGTRLGELDEEMVFEMRAGDVFLLGTTSWRVLEINQDRVLVAPAPGEPGRMPFWKGEGPGRPYELGQAIGKLTRELAGLEREEAAKRLQEKHFLDGSATGVLLDYLHDQLEATGVVPSDRTILMERFIDEIGDWRVVLLTPFGNRVHAPWATVVVARLRDECPGEVDVMWTDDGIAFRLPASDDPPDPARFLPAADEIEDRLAQELGSTALFAGRFRENAARALLLPRRLPGRRTPLWLQRRRSADLLKVAARHDGFPLILETFRECLRDVFDLPALIRLLRDVERRKVRVRTVDRSAPSPFAGSVLFSYVGAFIYDDDTPLAERRAQALSLDITQLRELLGDASLRELLEPEVVEELALELQRLDGRWRLRDADDVHDMLLVLGDQSLDELAARRGESSREALEGWIADLVDARRVLPARIGGEERTIAAEDAARYRDAVGLAVPPGLPGAFLESVADPLVDLVARYARTHVPFHAEDVAARLGVAVGSVVDALRILAERGRVVEGEILPGGRSREWCDTDVLATLKRRSLARLRKEIEPVAPETLARFLPRWQLVGQKRRGLDALLDGIEQLQGIALPASALDEHILPARVPGFRPTDLDELCAAGEIVWRGMGSIGPADGRVALYLVDHLPLLAPAVEPAEGKLCERVRELLQARGAMFFEEIQRQLGEFGQDVLDALWELVWAGEVTNDTLAPLRSLTLRARGGQGGRGRGRGGGGRGRFRSRRSRLPGSEGRWSLLVPVGTPSTTERQTALATQLLARYGVLTREHVKAEGLPGGFAALYPVLRAMEESGRARRGYFIRGLGGAQFALPAAVDLLRDAERVRPDEEDDEEDTGARDDARILAATDPANPYGAILSWPRRDEVTARPQRTAGARVLLHRGRLFGYVGKTRKSLLTFPCETAPDEPAWEALLIELLRQLADHDRIVHLHKIDGEPPEASALHPHLREAGFTLTTRGVQLKAISDSSR